MPSFANGHALLIGVGAYHDPAWSAPITVADAKGLADALRDPAIGAYPPEQVTLLHDQDASRDGVIDALKQLAQRTSAADTVLVFFCGHGALDTDGVYVFATHDTVFAGPRIQAGSGLTAPNLLALLRAIPAQKLLFIMLVSPAISARPSAPRMRAARPRRPPWGWTSWPPARGAP